jgi:hypothetical protein
MSENSLLNWFFSSAIFACVIWPDEKSKISSLVAALQKKKKRANEDVVLYGESEPQQLQNSHVVLADRVARLTRMNDLRDQGLPLPRPFLLDNLQKVFRKNLLILQYNQKKKKKKNSGKEYLYKTYIQLLQKQPICLHHLLRRGQL